MKFLLLSVLFLLVSCGEAPPPSSATTGQTRSLSPVTMDDSTFEKLTFLCQALGSKAQSLAFGNFQQYNFRVEDIKCGGAVAVSQVPVKISSFNFVSTGVPAAPFVFPDIETDASGVMGIICSNLSPRSNPIRTGTNSAIWVSTNSTLDCVPAANQTCVMIEHGTVQADATEFRISGQQWMRFNVDQGNPLFGYFTERRSITEGGCETGKVNDLRAILLN